MMTFTLLLFASSMWPAGADMYLNSSMLSSEDGRTPGICGWKSLRVAEVQEDQTTNFVSRATTCRNLDPKKREEDGPWLLKCFRVSGDTPLGLQFTWYLFVFFFAFFAFLSKFLRNANRLFDSQNNAASGYQIGDDCKPACKDENNNYDVTVEGATKGAMKFYQGSELYIEWHHQHGCGVGHPNLRCQNRG